MLSNPQNVLGGLANAEDLTRRVVPSRERALALATLFWLRGEAYLRVGDLANAQKSLNSGLVAISAHHEPLVLRANLLLSEGVVYRSANAAGKALGRFQQACSVFNELNDTNGLSKSLQNIAFLYYEANDNSRAEKYLKQAAQYNLSDESMLVSLHNSRGNVLLSSERYGEALSEYEQALAVARRMGSRNLEVKILVNIARNEAEARNYQKAEAAYRLGLSLANGGDSLLVRRQFLITAASVAADRGQLAVAEKLARESFDGVDLRKTGADFRNAHLIAHRIFRMSGDTERALEHLEAYRRLTDEATKVATTTSAALMAARFDYQNQQLTIERLTTEQLRRAAEAQRKLFLMAAGATTVIIVLLTIGLLTIRRSRNQTRAANIVLNETNVALEKALRAKTEFLATTSHEIRTPLNGILGMTQVMLADAALPGEQRERVEVVQGAGLTMRALVDDILDLAKMESGKLTIDPVPMNLPTTLREVARIWEAQAQAKGLGFAVAVDPSLGWIVSDPDRLRQIVFNLLSNAIKFTAAGEVGLEARLVGDSDAEGEGRRLMIAVRDTGIGIPEAKFDEIFESFRQVDASTTRRFGGTGLGLAICRNLAHALDGEIRVASREGEGTTFTVTLPYRAAEPVGAVVPESGDAGGTALLVLERNPIARGMLRALFAPVFDRVLFAANHKEAGSALESGRVAALLIDEATLRAEDGDVLARLSTLIGMAAGAAVILLRPPGDGPDCSQLLELGIGKILEKPIAGDALVAAVRDGLDAPPPADGRKPLVIAAA